MTPASLYHFQTCIAPHLTPPRPKSQIEHRYTEGIKAPLVCHLDYSSVEPKTPDHPGTPASCTLTAAYIRDVDIADLLSDEVRGDIEETALINHEANNL